MNQPGGKPGANRKSISHRYHLFEVEFEWELTKETIYLPPGCLQGERDQAVARGRPLTILETTRGQIDGFVNQLSFKCYLPEVASVGD